MGTRSRLAPIAMTGVLLGGGLAAATATAASADAPQAKVAAQSCYGGAKNYKSTRDMWPSVTGYVKFSGRCGDINVKPNANVKVAVCWQRTGKCQDHWTYAKKGRWAVVATNVRRGAGFQLIFWNNSTGKVAY
ncbi:hypothetical protein ACQB60_04500 [Actinomycetota bacterium Odt1-20B]